MDKRLEEELKKIQSAVGANPGKSKSYVYSVDEDGKTSEFKLDIKENLEGHYASYIILEATVDCPISVKFKKISGYVKWAKGLKKNTPFYIKTKIPVIEDIKLSPTSSTDFKGWVTTTIFAAEGN